jgi:hypothetical protein
MQAYCCLNAGDLLPAGGLIGDCDSVARTVLQAVRLCWAMDRRRWGTNVRMDVRRYLAGGATPLFT